MIDRYKTDLSVDKSTDRSVWIRIENQNRLGSADGKNPKIMGVSPIHRLRAVDVGRNKGLYRQ
jgi:hypothetical protein